MFRATVLALLVSCLSARDAEASCIGGLSFALANREIVMIFRGTAREVRDTQYGQIITFDVARVWKGDVRTREVIYNMRGAIDDGPSLLVEGVEYLVVAYQLDEIWRAKIDPPPEAPTTLAPTCNTRPFSSAGRQYLGDAIGYLPR